jgi:LacI family transcriptional regulator, repressor for deo operon, udp, cdd, tsx, nupC, and nupG
VSNPRQRPTIADVARRAGVSTAAVSFAVNDRPGVGPDTRARILQAAAELGWRPSASARALTQAKARAVGLVLARDPAHLELDAFFVRFLSGIERTLAPLDYALLLQLIPAGIELGAEAYERLAAAGRVDGFLITDVEIDDARFPGLERSGLPVVIAGHPAGDAPFQWVETDHARGTADVVAYLVELGHRDIAFFGESADYEFVQARLACWRQGLADAGLPEGVVVHDPGGLGALLDARPGAVVCTSDPLAMNVVRAATERGLSVPGDLSVAGFDDSPLAALASPSLTSVRVDYAEFGAAATATLLAAIAGEDAPRYDPSRPQLVPRASTAAPR